MIEHGVVALIVLAIFVSVYRRGTLEEVVIAGAICCVLLLLAAPAVTVLSILPLSILAIAFRKSRRHRAAYALAGAGGIIFVYGLGIVVHYPKFREAAAMREKYPVRQMTKL